MAASPIQSLAKELSLPNVCYRRLRESLDSTWYRRGWLVAPHACPVIKNEPRPGRRKAYRPPGIRGLLKRQIRFFGEAKPDSFSPSLLLHHLLLRHPYTPH